MPNERTLLSAKLKSEFCCSANFIFEWNLFVASSSVRETINQINFLFFHPKMIFNPTLSPFFLVRMRRGYQLYEKNHRFTISEIKVYRKNRELAK